MKIRLLSIVLLVLTFSSCKELKVDFFPLKEGCRDIETKWMDTIRLPEGIYYVDLDTSNCLLEVKYDDTKTSVAWINGYLEKKNLHFIPKEVIIDTLAQADSIPEIVVEEEIEIVEQKLEVKKEPVVASVVVKKPVIDSGKVIKDSVIRIEDTLIK